MMSLGLGMGVSEGGAVIPFDPTKAPGLVRWVDAASKTLNGSNVSALTDLSGNAAGYSQGTAAQQPPWNATGINGKPALDTRALTTGNGCFLTCAKNTSTLLTGASAEKHLVIQYANSPNGTGIFSVPEGTDGQASYFPFTNLHVFSDFFTTSRLDCGVIDVATNPVVLTIVSAPNSFTVYVNNVSAFTTATNTVGAPATASTILGQSSTLFWPGLFGAEITYSQAQTPAVRAQVVAYLRAEFGF